MNRWSELNLLGKVLYVNTLINLAFAFILASQGSWLSIFCLLGAFMGGIATYGNKYKHY